MRRTFTKWLFVIAIVLGFTTASYAQDDNSAIHPLTKQGSLAFLFNLGGIGTFSLSAPLIDSVGLTRGSRFPVAGVGGKFYISDDLALRVLLAFATETTGPDSASNTGTTFGIAAGVEYHFRPLYSTTPYIGAVVGFASDGETQKVPGGNGDNKSSLGAFSVAALAGFDWYFTRGIALGAEYQLGFTSYSGSQTAAGKTTDSPSSSSIGVGLQGSGSVHVVVHI